MNLGNMDQEFSILNYYTMCAHMENIQIKQNTLVRHRQRNVHICFIKPLSAFIR